MRWFTICAMTLLLVVSAFAVEATLGDRADALRGVLEAERFELEGAGGRDARPVIGLLRKAERALDRFVAAQAASPELDARQMRFAAGAARAVAKADRLGRLPADSVAVGELRTWLDGCRDAIDALVADTRFEVDRLVVPANRAKASRRLDKGVALLDDAATVDRDDVRAARLARAVPHISGALAKALKLCAKESKPGCPGGVIVDNSILVYRGRGVLTVYDVTWDLDLRTTTGILYAHRSGILSDMQGLIERRLPWSVARGERLDAFSWAPVETGVRVDGTVTWRTSVGELVVPVHRNP